MITLGPIQSLAASADTANAINCFLDGDTITSASPPDSFLERGPFLLGTSATSLAAAAVGQQILIGKIDLKNTLETDVVVQFYSNGTAAANLRYTVTVPASGGAGYEKGRGWVVYDESGLSIYNTIGSLDGDVVGAPGSNRLYGPAWSGPLNTIGAINTATPENVADSRAIPAADLFPNYLLRYRVRAFIQGTSGQKNLRLCVREDDAHSYLATFDAGVEGIVTAEFTIPVIAGAVQVGVTEVNLNNNALWFIDRQNAIAVDLPTDGGTIEARAWVANAADSITFDTADLQLERKRQ